MVIDREKKKHDDQNKTLNLSQQEHNQNKKRKIQQVGNFPSYYAYRLGGETTGSNTSETNTLSIGQFDDDPRLQVLEKEWFSQKKGLDIGCNEGVLTVQIAKQFDPVYYLGVDIDGKLISKARIYLKDCIQKLKLQEAYKTIKETSTREEKKQDTTDQFGDELPLSFRLWKAPPLAPPSNKRFRPSSNEIQEVTNPFIDGKNKTFPFNVVFKREDFLKDAHSGKEYDFITCFSVTKWIHLYHGDTGLIDFFKKIYMLLREGGKCIIEPQPWRSYHNRKFASEQTKANFHQIQLRPKDFPTCWTKTIGFKKCTLLRVCETSTHGFRRPIYLLEK